MNAPEKLDPQIELEVKNAELVEARDRLKLQAERYRDLYDFVPVGYFTIDADARIQAANLSGAAMLSLDRSRLINRSFSSFVAPESVGVFTEF